MKLDSKEYSDLCDFYYFLKHNINEIKFPNEYAEKRIKKNLESFSKTYDY